MRTTVIYRTVIVSPGLNVFEEGEVCLGYTLLNQGTEWTVTAHLVKPGLGPEEVETSKTSGDYKQ